MGRGAVAGLAALTLLVLAGCSGSSDSGMTRGAPADSAPATSTPTVSSPDPTNPAPTKPEDPIFPGSSPERRLSFYKGNASYPYRVNIVDQADELLEAMQLVNPDLNERDFTDVISTCEDVARGLDTDQLISNAAVRFDVDEGKAGLLVGTSKRFACPNAGDS